MNWLDIAFTVVILATAVISHSRGTLRSCFTLVGVLLGIWLSGRYSAGLADWLSAFLKEPSQSGLLAVLVIAVAVTVVVSVVWSYLLGLLTFDVEGVLDRVGGLAVGVVTALLVTQFLFTALALFPVQEKVTLGVWQSGLGRPLLQPQLNTSLWLLNTSQQQMSDLFKANNQ